MAEPTEFASKIRDLLKEGSTVQILDLFNDNKHHEEICTNSWDLIPIICEYLNETNENRNIEVYKCCQQLINIIAKQSTPEEALLQFIEEIEAATDDIKFLTLLKPLKIILLRVPDKRITSLAWCFNSIQTYLNKLETPDDLLLTDEEQLLLDNEPSVERINHLYIELLEFCHTFIGEILEDRNNNERLFVLRKALIQLLGKPIVYLNMQIYKETKSKIRRIIENLISEIFKILNDPFVFVEMRDNDHNVDLVKPNNLALGCFYYLILTEEICYDRLPKIYNSTYIFHHLLKYVNEMFALDYNLTIIKGVNLVGTLLKSIEKGSLSAALLDDENHSRFCKQLSNIIVYKNHENLRKDGLKLLHQYLWSFNDQGRYLLISNLIDCTENSSLRGNLIVQYKQMLCENLTSPSIYYKQHKLFYLLRKFMSLKDNEKTDLIDESDPIISTLNFLFYLISIDRNSKIGIDRILDEIKENYLNYLQKGVDLSKAHYELKIKELNDKNEKIDKKDDVDVKISVSGKEIMELPFEEKLRILNLSLTTLDMIQCLLSRVVECIASKNL